ncbi:phage holin family protein [Bombilactobacillus bombi]|uniref:phage holin family protein n=1 Tax=Bombilactobacillus bombi TaxID=1303590 RepID=UPI0015FBD4DF|nr:phage holin family protein [Bombilactobacillus bombi]
MIPDNVFNLIDKMLQSHSFTAGLVIAVLQAVQIPHWLYSDHVTIDHGVMLLILLFTFVLDWITGSMLSRRSPTQKLTSHAGIKAVERDFIIVSMCAFSIFLDFVFETKSFIFAFFTAAFIWQNFYSFLGNVAALGWDKYFPTWLFKMIHDEMLAKLEKYFPNGKDKK